MSINAARPNVLQPTADWQVANLNKLAERLEENQHQLNLHMGEYTALDYKGVSYVEDVPQEVVLKNIPSCNTPACIAGHAPQWFPDQLTKEFFVELTEKENVLDYDKWSKAMFTSELDKEGSKNTWEFIFGVIHNDDVEEAILRIQYIIVFRVPPANWNGVCWKHSEDPSEDLEKMFYFSRSSSNSYRNTQAQAQAQLPDIIMCDDHQKEPEQLLAMPTQIQRKQSVWVRCNTAIKEWWNHHKEK